MKPTFPFVVLALLLCCLVSCARGDGGTLDSSPVVRRSAGPTGDAGVVSSAHERATLAGVEILERGGNAFDAAVAIAATLTVVEPMNSNFVGGYGTLIVWHEESGALRYLDNNGRFPASVDSDVFRQAEDRRTVTRSAKAVSTPGNLAGFEALWREYGSAPWAELLEGAITAAAEGVEVSRPLAAALASAWPHFSAEAQAIFGRDGSALEAGELLRQKDLAASLRSIAEEGASALYGGGLGRAIIDEMEHRGGFLAMADLEAHRAEWFEPISIPFRDVEVVTAGPPSNSFAALVCLGIMSRFDNAALGAGSAAYLHRFAEATKHAYWARLRWAGGPEENPPPLDRLLSESYWREQADRIGERASEFEPPAPSGDEGADTTHFVVADRHGNVISATITLGQGFGSAVMAAGTGVWLNNSLAYSTFEPKGNPMDALPGRRKHSSKSPTMILRGGKPWVAIGTPGGHTIPQTVPQLVLDLVDFQIDLQAALDAGRIAFAEPDRLLVGERVPEGVRGELAALGHNVEVERGIGLAHAITIERDERGRAIGFTGAADGRGVGVAMALNEAD